MKTLDQDIKDNYTPFAPTRHEPRRKPISSYDGIGETLAEDDIAGWNQDSFSSRLERDCIHGTTEQPLHIDFVQRPTHLDKGTYVVFIDTFVAKRDR